MAPDTPTVLVTDDDADIRAGLIRMLAPLGVNVVEAANGRQALSILKQQRVDVVLSDLIMPRMSGLMLLHSMLEQGHHMPFVLVTGYGDKDSAIQALRLGAFDYLEKPVHESDFRSIMEEALRVGHEQRRYLEAIRRDGAPQGGHEVDRNAEIQIMKMRTVRFKGDSYDFVVSRNNLSNWHDLNALFVQEAEPQLAFAKSTIETLAKSEERSSDVTFLLRVFQTMRLASEAIRLNVFAEASWGIETFAAELKHAPEALTDEHVSLMLKVVQRLQTLIGALVDPEATETLRELGRMTEQLSQSRKSA